jgi:hypothetical protein
MAKDSKTPFLNYKSAALPTELCRAKGTPHERMRCSGISQLSPDEGLDFLSETRYKPGFDGDDWVSFAFRPRCVRVRG